ncbi:MAG: dTDP-4-dehydrorhamnose 3,5-epimerase [Bacteroidia bacterium]|nr:dTDP-4-dehydrorhamnose 3,5-epimerase [Bacteroidia bacterium]
MIKFIKTKLEGAWIIEPEVPYDERGSFYRTFCKEEFKKIGHEKEFVQFNQSINFKKGTLRGLHFQYPPYSEIKLVRCIKGAVQDFIVDLRMNSPTLFQYISVHLSEENKKSLYIPEGFAHGFITLTDNVELIYFHTEYYTPSAYGGVHYADPKINLVLEEKISVISEKDKNLPFMTDDFKGLDLSIKKN